MRRSPLIDLPLLETRHVRFSTGLHVRHMFSLLLWQKKTSTSHRPCDLDWILTEYWSISWYKGNEQSTKGDTAHGFRGSTRNRYTKSWFLKNHDVLQWCFRSTRNRYRSNSCRHVGASVRTETAGRNRPGVEPSRGMDGQPPCLHRHVLFWKQKIASSI